METIAMHFHCSQRLGERLTLHAGDDAAAAMWLEVGDHNPHYRALYASHKHIVDLVARTHGGGGTDGRGVGHDGHDGASSGGMLDACGPLAHQVHLWAAAATGGVIDGVESYLSVEDVLDCCHVVKVQFPVAMAVQQQVAEAVAKGRQGSELSQCTNALCGLLAAGDAVVSANIFENLQRILPFKQTLAQLGELLRHVDECLHHWHFNNDDTPLAPPPVLPAGHPAAGLRLSRVVLDLLRMAMFIDKPPALIADSSEIRELRRAALGRSPSSFWPSAVIMVGPPGAGKTAALPQGIELLHRRCGAPPSCEYARINPDFWIAQLCHYNNEHRDVANFVNHDTFLTAIAERRHLVFDSTGKSVLNTCGRVIGRLRRAGYCVHLVVVLASLPSCWRRIEARRACEGRAVPYKLAQETMHALKHALRTYLLECNDLFESTFVLDNDSDVPAVEHADSPHGGANGKGAGTAGRVLLAATPRSHRPKAGASPPPLQPGISSLLDDDEGGTEQGTEGPAKLLAHLTRSSTIAERHEAYKQAARALAGDEAKAT